MKLVIDLPRRFEGESEYQGEGRKLTVVPRLLGEAATRAPLLHMTVAGDLGAERRYLLCVNPSTGILSLREIKPEAPTAFDKLPPDRVLPSEPTHEGDRS